MRSATVLLCAGFVAACGGGPSADRQAEALREKIRPQITPVMSKEYPGATITPLTTCMLENLTDEELVMLAQAALQGISGRDVQMIRAVVRRPETRACAYDAGVTGYF